MPHETVHVSCVHSQQETLSALDLARGMEWLIIADACKKILIVFTAFFKYSLPIKRETILLLQTVTLFRPIRSLQCSI